MLGRCFVRFICILSLSMPLYAQSLPITTTNPASARSETINLGAETQKLNLNLAKVKDLVKIKGLNRSRARAIIAYRKKHGDFKHPNELIHVKGFKKIKTTMLSKIESQLTV